MANVTNEDREHLRLLAIFHYLVAGLTGLMGCTPIFHLCIGVAILIGAVPGKNADEAASLMVGGVLLVVLASAGMALGWSCAFAIGFAGRMLAKQRRYTFCLVMAGIECMFMPFGTILGVFTIIVLMRPSVKTLFQTGDAAA